jgi:hypothetical protein
VESLMTLLTIKNIIQQCPVVFGRTKIKCIHEKGYISPIQQLQASPHFVLTNKSWLVCYNSVEPRTDVSGASVPYLRHLRFRCLMLRRQSPDTTATYHGQSEHFHFGSHHLRGRENIRVLLAGVRPYIPPTDGGIASQPLIALAVFASDHPGNQSIL